VAQGDGGGGGAEEGPATRRLHRDPARQLPRVCGSARLLLFNVVMHISGFHSLGMFNFRNN